MTKTQILNFKTCVSGLRSSELRKTQKREVRVSYSKPIYDL